MTPPPQIELTLKKQKTPFSEMTLVENIDMNLLTSLIDSQLLQDKYDDNSYTQKLASQLYLNEKNQLETYKKNYNKNNNNIPVNYKKPRHGWGRSFPVKSLGLTSFSKKSRNTLIKDKYIDFDLSNAQPAIIGCICKSNNIECKFIDEYNSNRPAILQTVSDAYNVSKDKAKGLFIRLAFFGSFEGWLKDCGLPSNTECLPFIYEFKNQLNIIANVIRKSNPELYETARKIKTDKNQLNIIGSFFSLYLQEYETRIMESVYLFLKKNTNIIEGDVLTYEFDGFKLLTERVNAFGGSDKLISELNNAVLSQTGFELSFEVKEITKFYEIEYIPFVFAPPMSNEQVITNDAFEKKKRFDEWELTHGKIINKGFYYCELPNGLVMLKTPKQLTDAYSHLEAFYIGGFPIPFITTWINNNPSIKSKDDIGVYPNEGLCPNNVYNMWEPFPFKNLTAPYTKNLEALAFFRRHILILCDNDEPSASHFEKWIGHMIQHPELKSICPVLISQQGAGKGSLMMLLKLLIGNSKFYQTSNPSRDIWGQFNSQMADAFLVNLDELSKNDTMDSMGKIKALITEPTITINTKGVSQYEIQSHHRFIITTNSPDPIPIDKKERRMWLLSSSNELIRNAEYFNKFNDLLKNSEVIRTTFDYFNEIPDLKDFGSSPFPISEYQKNVFEGNKSVVEVWLESYVRDNSTEEFTELLSSYVFRLFQNYKQANGLRFDISITKLIMNLYNLKLDGIIKGKHTNKGNIIKFDIGLLKKYFNIGCLINYYDIEGDGDGDISIVSN